MFTAKDFEVARAIKPGINLARLDPSAYAWLKIAQNANSSSTVYDATIENGIAYFDRVTASQPLVSLKLNIPVTQTGSGTPSPDNIRDFIGFSGVTIGHTSGYGKYFQGLLNGTYGFVDMGDLTWGTSTGTPYRFNAELPLLKTQVTSVVGNLLTKDYTAVSYDDSGSMDKIICGYTAAAGQKIRIQDYAYIGLTAEQFKTAMQGKYLIYELETPTTPTTTPEQFATLCQAFGITGNTYTISFGQTVYSANLDVLTGKLYLPERIKTIDDNTSIAVSNGIFAVDDFFDINNDTESVDCNVYQRGENRTNTAGVMNNNPDYSFCCRLGSTPTRVMIKDTRYSSVEDYKAWLTNNPVKIAVKLAEPIEVQLTPTVINTLIGENVIFADVANVTECKYTRK